MFDGDRSVEFGDNRAVEIEVDHLRGRRSRRGNVRVALGVLGVIQDEHINGYTIVGVV
jgi:hypothetical protein